MFGQNLVTEEMNLLLIAEQEGFVREERPEALELMVGGGREDLLSRRCLQALPPNS